MDEVSKLSPKKKIMLQYLPCLFLMVVTTNAKIKGTFKCTGPKATTCREVDLPTVNFGFFNCSGTSVGDKCNLTCRHGYYRSESNETVCEKTVDLKGNWTAGNFACSEIKCFEMAATQNLMCPPSPAPYLEGDVCNFSCEDGFYPFPSNRVVCMAGNGENGGEWFGGFCRQIECSQWNAWGEKVYKFISTKQTWIESRQLCEGDGAHLVAIKNKEENDFVRKLVSRCIKDKYISIGLNDIEEEGVYQWSDNAEATYNNWDTDEDEPDGFYKEDCVCIKQIDSKWHDYPCDRSYTAV